METLTIPGGSSAEDDMVDVVPGVAQLQCSQFQQSEAQMWSQLSQLSRYFQLRLLGPLSQVL
jgi:hypothetical protein